MNKTIDALKLAEEALVDNIVGRSGRTPKTHEAIAAIREALAEPVQQKPVAEVEITYGREPECYVTGNIDDFPEGVFKLYAGPVSVEAAVLAERDACAKVCDDYAAKCAENENWEAEDVSLINAAAIRARGEK